MKSFSFAISLLLSAFVTAQDRAPKRSLEELIEYHEKQIARSADQDAQVQAMHTYVAALREYLANEAKGEERHETRFVLVGALLANNERKQAKSVLKRFDPKTASSLNCAGAAYWAGVLGMKSERTAWVGAAIANAKNLDDRMELGVLLVSQLGEPEKGEQLFARALAGAKGDAAQSVILWHQARATREREDLPEGAYEKALRELAKAYPKTRFGSIAADRLKAMEFKIGGDPLPFAVRTLSGDEFSLRTRRGRAVLLWFWVADEGCAEAARVIQELHRRYGEKSLEVLGICLDEKRSVAVATVKSWQTTHAQAFVENGWNADLALRYRVENTPHCLLIGRDGKIAGMNFVLMDDAGQQELIDAVEKVVGGK